MYEDYLAKTAASAEAHGSYCGSGGMEGQGVGESFEALAMKGRSQGEAQDGKAGKGKKGGHRKGGSGIGMKRKGAKNSATARAAIMHRALGRYWNEPFNSSKEVL